LPADALLGRYADPALGAFTDAFVATIPRIVSLQELIAAFYSSPVIRLELLAIGLIFRKPGSAAHARRLAAGEAQAFSAWDVEDRTPDQILMREVLGGKTRSWLKVEPQLTEAAPLTRIYFGSAVLPAGSRRASPRMSPLVAALLPFHKVYSRSLLNGARAGLLRPRRA
jgi:hypothetical protein